MQRAEQQFLERPISILTFLEGTRFTEEKKTQRNSKYKYLLNPRTGGLSFALDSLDSKVDRIVDITLVYEEFVPGFWDLMCGRCPRVQMNVRTLEVGETFKPNLKQEIAQWWARKDEEIERLRSTHM